MAEIFIIEPRGVLEANLPAHARERELIVCTDSGKMFIGQGAGQPLKQVGGSVAPVTSVFGRVGDVVAQSGDYSAYYDALGAATLAQSNAESFATSAVGTETTRAETAEGLLVPKTTTVNGHALSGNVTVTASDLSLATVATSGSYTDLSNTPTIPAAQVNSDWNAVAGVAQILNKPTLFSGAYSDLTGKPTLFSGAYTDLTGAPSLATVATSGSYTDLSNTPTIPAAQVNSDWNAVAGVAQILNKPDLSAKADLVAGVIPNSQIPPLAITKPNVVASEAAMLALTAEEGDVAIRTDINENFILGPGGDPTVLADWIQLLSPVAPVQSVNGQTGTVSLTLPASKTSATHKFLQIYNATSGTFTDAQPDYGDLTNTPSLAAIATSGKWSDLQNATAALTLANGTNATTFNQTSAAAWSWANTTAATSLGVNQNSPLLNLAGTYFTLGASAADTWSLQNVIATAKDSATVGNTTETAGSVVTMAITAGTGSFASGDQVTFTNLPTYTWLNGTTQTLTAATTSTSLVFTDSTAHGSQATHNESGGQVTQANPLSVLSLAHSGSASVQVQIPAGTTTIPSLLFAGQTIGFSAAAAQLYLETTGGSNIYPSLLLKRGDGTTVGSLVTQSSGSVNYMQLQAVSTPCVVEVEGSLTTTIGLPIVWMGNTSVNLAGLTAGTQTGIQMGNGSAGTNSLTPNLVFNPAYGVTSFVACSILPQVNQAAVTGSITNYSLTTNVVTFTLSTMGSAFQASASNNIVVTGFTGGQAYLNGTWPVSGAPTTTQLKVSLTHANDAGGAFSGTATQQATGAYTGLQIAVTETALGGTPNYLINCLAGASGTTQVFAVDNLGSMYLAKAAAGAPTSAGTAGTIGQILRYGGVLYFCSVTGAAGSATWNSLNMSAV